MWIAKVRKLAKKAGREALILWFAIRNPDTPLPLKLAAGAALGYFASPVDLLPDFMLIGWIDDLVLLSLGVPFLIRSLPPAVRADAEQRADLVLTTLGFPPVREGDGTVGAQARPAKPRRRRSGADDVVDAKIVRPASGQRSGVRAGRKNP